MNEKRDGTEGWYYDRGWRSYQMSDEEWARRRIAYGVGIKTNGIGRRVDYLNRPRQPLKQPYAGSE